MSCGIDVHCQEAFSQTPSRAAQHQENSTRPEGVLLEGVLLDDFPGTAAEKREEERIFREYADVFTREDNYASRNPHRA